MNDFNSIPFLLELKVTQTYKLEDGNRVQVLNGNEARDIGFKLIERISSEYPFFNVDNSITIFGDLPRNKSGPSISIRTTPRYFREIFGDNIESGISVLWAPIPIPCGIYRTWYQVGELTIPDNLNDYVENVYLSRYATGSFRMVDHFKPKEAKY